MRSARFLIPLYQDVVSRVHEQDLKNKAVLPHPVQDADGVPEGLLRAHIQAERRL